jgi:GNAT superfamily N-acetyltransferase
MTWVADDASNCNRPSNCEASFMGDHWYLNRVKVHDADQGKGIGRELVQRLQDALRRHWEAQEHFPEPRRLVVTPGGYGSNPADLEKFYASCGFETKSPVPELLMEWTP